MKKSILPIAILLACSVISGNAYRILAAFPVGSKSHTHTYYALTTELAKRGHEVVVITPFPLKEPVANQKEIFLPHMQELQEKNTFDPWERRNASVLNMMTSIYSTSQEICVKGLNHPEIQELINSEKKFDLVILSLFFTDCFLGLVHKLQAPMIGISANTAIFWLNDMVGNPEPYSYVPNIMFPFTDRMTFAQRLVNTLVGVTARTLREFVFLPMQWKFAKEVFGDSLPYLSEIERNVSLIFVNTQLALNYPRPFVPGIVQVGGMHLKPPKELPKSLGSFIDDAKDGVIYFSLGSAVRSDKMPAEKRQLLLNVFAQLPQRVLWKWESDSLPGKPENVKVAKWLPQQDILAHPNVKLFITHGGLLSLQEALYHAKSVLGIPIFADQELNMKRAVDLGFGEKQSFDTLTEDGLLEAIRKVMGNQTYKDNAMRLSAIFKDQPQSPLDRAVFWTEYVIRHKGAPHLRSAAVDLPWYKYFLIDVIAFLVLIVTLFSTLAFVILRGAWKILRGKKDKVKESRKKNR